MSISRISDNKHHVGDVVAGALIGAAGTLFTVCIDTLTCDMLLMLTFKFP